MANTLSEFEFTKRGRTPKYDWDNWFNGSIWELRIGEDIPSKEFKAYIYNVARTRRMSVKVAVLKNSLVIQATKKVRGPYER